jgi:DNA repair/transcription protein MET18/MMS19
VLKSMGDRFLSGYITLADGEKDPRNLMIAFAIARVLAIEFDISTKLEVRSAPLAVTVSNVAI